MASSVFNPVSPTMETKSATQMATIYGMKSSVAFNKMLMKCGIINHTEKGYVLNSSFRGCGYIAIVDAAYFLPNGIRAIKKKAVWTEKGQQFIRQRLGRIGIVPVSEQADMFTTN